MILKVNKIRTVFFVSITLTASCSSAQLLINESLKKYSLNFSYRLASKLIKTVSGEPHYVSFEEYNHSPAHYFFYGSISPQKIYSGSINYFSYIVHWSGDSGDHAFGEEFVRWEMDFNDFSVEVGRVSTIIDSSTNKGVIHSLDLFFNQSYIAIYNDDSEFSYAIIEEDACAITYIYFFNIGNRENLVFDEKYKPFKMLQDSDFSGDIKMGSYNFQTY